MSGEVRGLVLGLSILAPERAGQAPDASSHGAFSRRTPLRMCEYPDPTFCTNLVWSFSEEKALFQRTIERKLGSSP